MIPALVFSKNKKLAIRATHLIATLTLGVQHAKP